MSETNKPGIVFWIIGIIALIWNGWGSFLYIAQAYDMEIATKDLSQEQTALLEGMPAWYTALFAIAVFAGVIGAIIFLMRKKMTVTLFIISFIAATINQVYWLFRTNAVEVFSDHQPYLMPVVIVAIGIFLIWYSKNQKAKGILS
jgi:high-affinity Fe2+/Pb2+ permease